MSSETRKPTLGGFSRLERKPITVSREELCSTQPLRPGEPLPLLIQPTVRDLDLKSWLENNRDRVSAYLQQHGGVLFRGFNVTSATEFEDCVRALSGELLEYTYRSTPRKRVEGNIYTSTEYPADRSIPFHNEMSYSRSWPLKLWFFSQLPATAGGQTPIADSRRVFQHVPVAIREDFAHRGVMYVRNYGHGLDLPWEEVFQTQERTEVERLCLQVGLEYEWGPEGRLTTRQVCQGTAKHPQTGEDVWFNQAHLFHVSSLPLEARAMLLQQFSEEELPRNAYYGDGVRIELDVLDEIRAAYERATVMFDWQKSDLLLVDNMLTAHGRAPFEGPRKVLVGMAERCGSVACVEM